jgi:hypothetical protein
MPHKKSDGETSGQMPHKGAAPRAVGPSAEAVVTGNSNPELGLFGGVAKGVK